MKTKKLSRRRLFFGSDEPSRPEPFLERFYRDRTERPTDAPSFITDPTAWSTEVEASPIGMIGVTPAIAHYEDAEEES